ncbi:MAG: hypothetical protein ACF8XB_09735 [Planctomycetota bacterium JB042]
MKSFGAPLLCPIFLGWPQRFIWSGNASGGGGGGITTPSTGVPGSTPGNGGPVETFATIPNAVPQSPQPVELAKESL